MDSFQFSNYCFTTYNIDDFMFNIGNFMQKHKYLVFQIEECPKTGNYHIQGYAECFGKLRMSTIHKIVGHKMHIEKRRGSQQQAIDYCQKDETYVKPHRYQYGRPAKQGERNDLSSDIEIIQNGGSLQDISPSNYIRYHKGFEKLQQLKMKPRDIQNPPIITWITGKAGSGKTKYIYDHHDSVYIKNPNNKWWDSYTQQEVILIDDFRGWSEGYEDLLRLLDRYPYQGETKGSSVNINSPYIYITSVLEPKDILTTGHQKDTLEQLLRRISKIKYIG